jgi:hypothetical protein
MTEALASELPTSATTLDRSGEARVDLEFLMILL